MALAMKQPTTGGASGVSRMRSGRLANITSNHCAISFCLIKRPYRSDNNIDVISLCEGLCSSATSTAT